MMEKAKKLIASEATRYLFVGGCTTLVNLSVFWVLCNFTPLGQSDWGITASNITSISAAILFAYVTNKLFVFRSKTNSPRGLFLEMAKFVGARLSTMAIEVGGVWVTVSLFKQDEMIGKIETQVLVLIGNYLISKFIVFRKKQEEKE